MKKVLVLSDTSKVSGCTRTSKCVSDRQTDRQTPHNKHANIQ